mgnify:CR=1 FL=1
MDDWYYGKYRRKRAMRRLIFLGLCIVFFAYYFKLYFILNIIASLVGTFLPVILLVGAIAYLIHLI